MVAFFLCTFAPIKRLFFGGRIYEESIHGRCYDGGRSVGRLFRQYNVADEEQDPNSILNYFREVIRLRKANPALVFGKYTLLDEANPQVYAYLREEGDQRFLVVLNFSPKNAETTVGIDLTKADVVLHNYPKATTASADGTVTLRPSEAVIYKL